MQSYEGCLFIIRCHDIVYLSWIIIIILIIVTEIQILIIVTVIQLCEVEIQYEE